MVYSTRQEMVEVKVEMVTQIPLVAI